jgi:hypothetical protein
MHLVLRCRKFSYSCITATVDVVGLCQFTSVLCIILTLCHVDEFLLSELLTRREADHIVLVRLLEVRKKPLSAPLCNPSHLSCVLI